jgi:hydrogenase maturation protease
LKTLVLGLGNDLYGDDGVGLQVVRLLEEERAAGRCPGEPAGATDFAASSLCGLALLEVIAGYEALVIVDTIQRSDPVAGRVAILDLADVRDVPGPSPHYISVPQTLALGRSLGLKMPEVVKIIAVEATNMHCLGEGLSDAMRLRLPEILSAACQVLSGPAFRGDGEQTPGADARVRRPPR